MIPMRSLCLALVLAATTLPAAAQRASLADRVAVLEQRAANTQGNVELLNQLALLRTELQALRSKVEELEQANEQLRSSQRTQYLDVDGRLERLETGAPRTAAPAVAPATRPAAAASAPNRAAPATPSTDGTRPVAAALPTGSERTAYDMAFDALKAGRYADSARLFADFLERHPGGVFAPNALYWLGESYYVTQNYALALESFDQLLDRFPTHDKAPGALLKVGLARLGMRQEDAARAAFADVVARYPGSDAARLAADRLQAPRGAR